MRSIDVILQFRMMKAEAKRERKRNKRKGERNNPNPKQESPDEVTLAPVFIPVGFDHDASYNPFLDNRG